MLRIKKFNTFKNIGINNLFNHNIESNPISESKPESINNIYIKSTKKYELIKEILLEPYILKLNDILLIHIKDDLINDFKFLYKDSNKYLFDIYETSYPNLNNEESYIKMYHIFCISKTISSYKDYINFLKANDSDNKYYCLSLIYGPSIIVNNRFDICSEFDKYNCKYKFVKSLGKGKVNISLRTFVKNIINIANNYQDILPPHYLKLN